MSWTSSRVEFQLTSWPLDSFKLEHTNERTSHPSIHPSSWSSTSQVACKSQSICKLCHYTHNLISSLSSISIFFCRFGLESERFANKLMMQVIAEYQERVQRDREREREMIISIVVIIQYKYMPSVVDPLHFPRVILIRSFFRSWHQWQLLQAFCQLAIAAILAGAHVI